MSLIISHRVNECLELVARTTDSTTHDTCEQIATTFRMAPANAWCASTAQCSGDLERLTLDDRLDGKTDPIRRRTGSTRPAHEPTPVVRTYRRRPFELREHQVLVPRPIATRETSLIQRARHGLRAILAEVKTKHLAKHLRLVFVGNQNVARDPGPDLHRVLRITVRRFRAWEVALTDRLAHRCCGAHTIDLRLVLIDHLEEALQENTHWIIRDLLADVVNTHTKLAELTLHDASFCGVAREAREAARPHKVEGEDIVVGRPLELVVLACKSNALRCRLLRSAREITLRTAVRDEIPGSIITVTPKKHWTHARHPYLSGEVTAIRIDASVLGLVPLTLHREDATRSPRGAMEDERPVYRLAQAGLADDDAGGEILLEAQECIDAGANGEADELLHKVLALDRRYLDAHALLGERNLASWPSLSFHHFELGVAIGSLTVGEDLDGVLPWGLVDNRPFLRCLHGLSRALLRRDRREGAVKALRRLLRLDPGDHLGARASLDAIEAGKTWRDMETAT